MIHIVNLIYCGIKTKFSQDAIDEYGKQYVEIRENFHNFKDKIKAQQSISKKITPEQKGYLGKMVDFALRSASKTTGQPSTSGQPSAEEEELPEYSQSSYARTNISLPINEIIKIIKNKPELKKERKKI